LKNRLKVITVLVVLGVAFGNGLAGRAQNRPIVGGYKPASKSDAGVKAAAEFAISERGETEGVSLNLVSIERAETQVVAGINYRLCLKISLEDDPDETQEVTVVVFRSLQKTHSLKSWEVADCGESQ
jgi:hypothetical protein